MKKNRMMRLASGLLVAVLLTTSMIAGTFAKYTTQDSAYDSARVAKWGVELQAFGNLYGESYTDAIVADVTDTGANIRVQSNGKTEDVVAPGTKNEEGMTFSLKGQPEVDGKVTTTMKIQNVFLKAGTYGVMIPVDAGVITAANFNEFTDQDADVALYTKDDETYTLATEYADDKTYYTFEDEAVIPDGTTYYPVEYKLAYGGTATSEKTEYDVKGKGEKEDTLTTIAEKVAKQLGLTAGTAADDTSVTYTGTKEFDSNTDLASWKLDGLTLTWAWDFEQDANDKEEGDSAQVYDKADTILGLLDHGKTDNTVEGTVVKLNDGGAYVAPVEYTDYCLDTQFSIDITVTQVD